MKSSLKLPLPFSCSILTIPDFNLWQMLLNSNDCSMYTLLVWHVLSQCPSFILEPPVAMWVTTRI
jgi:hypothetical protein